MGDNRFSLIYLCTSSLLYLKKIGFHSSRLDGIKNNERKVGLFDMYYNRLDISCGIEEAIQFVSRATSIGEVVDLSVSSYHLGKLRFLSNHCPDERLLNEIMTSKIRTVKD